jgi:retinol-binding protein 3
MKLPESIAFTLLLVAPALPAQSGPPPLEQGASRVVAEALAAALEEHYVFPDKAAELGRVLRETLAAGDYDGLTDAGALAERLTVDMLAVVDDRHLRVAAGMPPHGAAPGGPAEPVDEQADRERMERLARRDNWGFAKVERLEGNVGLLDLRGFLPAELAGPTAAGAMAFLAGSDALIIDLRRNGGGEPSMIQFLSTYFFEEPVHLNSFAWRGKEQVDQFWTLPWVPGRRLPDVPLYVLTSEHTFSAAEEFTYNLKNLGRATIVGETTGGGAHPGGMHPLGAGLAVFIPEGRAINPVTGTNWEGTGVGPDVACPADAALDTALAAALERLAGAAPDEGDATALRWAAQAVQARLQPPPVLEAAALARLTGQFGPRTVSLEAGQLWYQREGRPRMRMLPMTSDTFTLEDMPRFRVRFEESDGRVVRLVGLYEDGREEPSERIGG